MTAPLPLADDAAGACHGIAQPGAEPNRRRTPRALPGSRPGIGLTLTLLCACAQTPQGPPTEPTPTPSAGARTRQHSSHQLTVATLSVAGLRFGLERVADAVAALDADLIGLQAIETGSARTQGRDAPALIAARLGYHVAFTPAAALDQGQRGVALLSRARLEGIRRVVLGRDGDAPGVLLLARTRLAGLRWTVGVVELSSPATTEIDDPRRAQARQIAEELGGRDACVLLTDLSGPAESTAWVPLTLVGDFVGLDAGPTYPARAPTLRHDHVLISPELWAPAVRIVDTGASDHRALVVQVATRR